MVALSSVLLMGIPGRKEKNSMARTTATHKNVKKSIIGGLGILNRKMYYRNEAFFIYSFDPSIASSAIDLQNL